MAAIKTVLVKLPVFPSGKILVQETVCCGKKCIRGVDYYQTDPFGSFKVHKLDSLKDNVTGYHQNIGDPAIVSLPHFSPMAPMHLMEAHTLDRQHAEILPPHAFSDTRPAPPNLMHLG